MAGIDWLKNAVNLGRDNPRAVFGGAGLIILVLVVMVIALTFATMPLEGANPDVRVVFGSLLLAMLPVMFVMAAMMVGFLRLIYAVESGRQASPGDVFAGFRDWPASLRAIGFVIVLAIIQNLLLAALIATLAPDFGSWYLHNLQGSLSGHPQPPPETLPAGFSVAMAVMFPLNLFFYALQAVGLGQISLRGRGVGGALADGASGAIKNLLPMLVAMLLIFAALFALMLVLAVVVAFLALMGKLVGMWLVAVVAIPLYVAFMLAMVVVAFGVMYYMWRDICGDGAATPALPSDRIQA